MTTIIIVSYYDFQEIQEYIDRCRENIYPQDGFCFLVVDNTPDQNYGTRLSVGSRYGEFEYQGFTCYRHFHASGVEIVVVESGSNTGYAVGNNLGARLSDFIWKDNDYLFSNSDISFETKIDLRDIESIYARDDQIAAIGPRVIDVHGNDCNPRCYLGAYKETLLPYFNLALGDIFRRKLITLGDSQTSGVCYSVSGCFFFAKRTSFWQVEGFDEGTFLYYEEQILAERFKKISHLIWYSADCIVVHEHDFSKRTLRQEMAAWKQCRISSMYYAKKYLNMGTMKALAFSGLGRFSLSIYSLEKRIKRIIRHGR